MDKQKILKIVQAEARTVWAGLCEMYPSLEHFKMPEIVLNNRIWRTAGFCYQESNRVELGTKFFLAGHTSTMLDIILPHELIHQADWNLYGVSEKKCGHGEKWCEMMVEYGLEPEALHKMWINR